MIEYIGGECDRDPGAMHGEIQHSTLAVCAASLADNADGGRGAIGSM
jgi:hypothetical protein